MSSDSKNTDTDRNKSEYDFIKIPVEHSEIIFEELALLTRNKHLTEEQQTTISNAVNSIDFLSDYEIEVLHKLDVEREENEHFENNLDQVRPIPIKVYDCDGEECVSCGNQSNVHECWHCDIKLCIDCDKDGMRTDLDDHTYCWQCGPSGGV